jgi:hypothetical protein
VIGQNAGNDVERAIIDRTNKMTISQLDPEMKHFIFSIVGDGVDKQEQLLVRKPKSTRLRKKTDLEIEIQGSVAGRVSIKSGRGNSVHQESIHEFAAFLNAQGASKLELNSLLLFHWGDGTIDGSAHISDRLAAPAIRHKYPREILQIDQLFTRLTRQITQRALIGLDPHNKPGHLAYFPDRTLKNGLCVEVQRAVDFHSQKKNKADDIKIGNLNFQAYHRCLKGQETYSNKNRNDIQIKWPNLAKDLETINGTK